jgi:hypothetical protein
MKFSPIKLLGIKRPAEPALLKAFRLVTIKNEPVANAYIQRLRRKLLTKGVR